MLWINLALGQPAWFAYEYVAKVGDIRAGRCTIEVGRLTCAETEAVAYDSARRLLSGIDPIFGTQAAGPTFAWAYIPTALVVGAEVHIRDMACTVDPPGGADRLARVPMQEVEVRCTGVVSLTQDGAQREVARTELWYYDAATGFVLACVGWNSERGARQDEWLAGKVTDGFRITGSSYAAPVDPFLVERPPVPAKPVVKKPNALVLILVLAVTAVALAAGAVCFALLWKHLPASWRESNWSSFGVSLRQPRPQRFPRIESAVSEPEARALCEQIAPAFVPLWSLGASSAGSEVRAHTFDAGYELLTLHTPSRPVVLVPKSRVAFDALHAVVGKRDYWSTMAPDIPTTRYTLMRRLPQAFSVGPHIAEARAAAHEDLLALAGRHNLRADVQRLLDSDQLCLVARRSGLSLGFVAIQNQVALVHSVVSDAQSGDDTEAALDGLRELVGALARRAEQRGAREVYIVVRHPHSEAFRGVGFQPVMKLYFGGETVPPLFGRAGVV